MICDASGRARLISKPESKRNESPSSQQNAATELCVRVMFASYLRPDLLSVEGARCEFRSLAETQDSNPLPHSAARVFFEASCLVVIDLFLLPRLPAGSLDDVVASAASA